MVKKVLVIRRKLKRDPELADLIDFVSDENLIVNDPVFSKEAVEQYIEKKPVKCGNKLSTLCSRFCRISCVRSWRQDSKMY